MPREDFTKDELRTLLSLVSSEIEADRFPFSERARRLKELRSKLRRALGEAEYQPADEEKRRR
jgi:hypothetical protein